MQCRGRSIAPVPRTGNLLLEPLGPLKTNGKQRNRQRGTTTRERRSRPLRRPYPASTPAGASPSTAATIEQPLSISAIAIRLKRRHPRRGGRDVSVSAVRLRGRAPRQGGSDEVHDVDQPRA